jgi:hypothetical protein
MKRRFKIILVVLILLITALFWLFLPNNRARIAAEKNRRLLREQGVKTTLAEFELALPPELRSRSEDILKAGLHVRELIPNRGLDLMRSIGPNYAPVLAREQNLTTESSENLWPSLRTNLAQRGPVLDAACLAVVSGPIRFEPTLSASGDLFLAYLSDYRALVPALAARTLLELHDEHPAAAWTNLLALTRLATAWQTEPAEFAYMLKFGCVAVAERATWESLQARRWSDEELITLGQEWRELDVFGGLAETPSLARASVLSFCAQGRKQAPPPVTPLPQIASDFFTSPARAWGELTAGSRDSRYRNYGSYEDENAAMIYYRERELELRAATNANCWAAMRSLPGVTNVPPLRGGSNSRLPNLANQNPLGRGPFLRQRQTLLGRAAEAETRRRLVLTALALERFQLSHTAYPRSLADLVPQFLAALPTDFMDGKPLRYQVTPENHFVLYSTGLDCVDDGGQMRTETNSFPGSGRGFYRAEGPDLLWPRPATLAEIESNREIEQSLPGQSRVPALAPTHSSDRRSFRRRSPL